VKPDINSVEVHPKLIYNIHPVDGVLVGAGSSDSVVADWKILRAICD
jgi:hypothetical protein